MLLLHLPKLALIMLAGEVILAIPQPHTMTSAGNAPFISCSLEVAQWLPIVRGLKKSVLTAAPHYSGVFHQSMQAAAAGLIRSQPSP